MKKFFIAFLILVLAAEVAARIFYKGRRFPEPFTLYASGAAENEPVLKFPDVPKTENEFLVVVTGGSTAYGMGASSKDKAFSPQLEELLNKLNLRKRVTVFYSGLPAFEALDELTLYFDRLKRMQPDMIIMLSG